MGAGDKHLLSEIEIKKMNDLLKLFKLISGSKFVDQEYSNGSCSRLAHLERKIDHVHPCASLAICEIPRWFDIQHLIILSHPAVSDE